MKFTTDQFKVCSASGLTHPQLKYALENNLTLPLHSGVQYENPYFSSDDIQKLRLLKSRGVYVNAGL